MLHDRTYQNLTWHEVEHILHCDSLPIRRGQWSIIIEIEVTEAKDET